MRFNGHLEDYAMELLVGRRAILSAERLINAHRERTFQSGQMLTSVEWFLAKSSVWNELPAILVVRRADIVLGIVMLHYPRVCYGALPYGLARAGARGETSIIAAPSDQFLLLRLTAQFLVTSFLAHTAVLTMPLDVRLSAANKWAGPGFRGFRQARVTGERLDLHGGFEATLQRLSYKLRRNLRYYRRRAIDAGCYFIPNLSPEQRLKAVAALFNKGRYPLPYQRALKWELALQAAPAPLGMGLKNAAGEWLSYIAGWREQSTSYVDWQLNDDHFSGLSISAVMRSYLLENEVEQGSDAVVFVGGLSSTWAGALQSQQLADLVVIGDTTGARILQRGYQWSRPETEVAQLYERAQFQSAHASNR